MSGLDKDRLRNQTVSFRVSPDERLQLEARIKVSGLPKGEYFIKCLLHGEITIAVGKYQSDRLSLELKRLRERIDSMDECDFLAECKALLLQLLILTGKKDGLEALSQSDFLTKE